jgi:adenylate cyclase
VKKFKGDIDKFVGDCVVALFTGDDMELNAIRCAVETHRGLKELNASSPDKPPIRVGIGIVTGEVILGSIGSEDRLDYTIIGSNVNLCSRLCSSAGPGETLIAESTYTRVQGLVAAEKVDPIKVKGFSEAIPVYKMS